MTWPCRPATRGRLHFGQAECNRRGELRGVVMVKQSKARGLQRDERRPPAIFCCYGHGCVCCSTVHAMRSCARAGLRLSRRASRRLAQRLHRWRRRGSSGWGPWMKKVGRRQRLGARSSQFAASLKHRLCRSSDTISTSQRNMGPGNVTSATIQCHVATLLAINGFSPCLCVPKRVGLAE